MNNINKAKLAKEYLSLLNQFKYVSNIKLDTHSAKMDYFEFSISPAVFALFTQTNLVSVRPKKVSFMGNNNKKITLGAKSPVTKIYSQAYGTRSWSKIDVNNFNTKAAQYILNHTNDYAIFNNKNVTDIDYDHADLNDTILNNFSKDYLNSGALFYQRSNSMNKKNKIAEEHFHLFLSTKQDIVDTVDGFNIGQKNLADIRSTGSYTVISSSIKDRYGLINCLIPLNSSHQDSIENKLSSLYDALINNGLNKTMQLIQNNHGSNLKLNQLIPNLSMSNGKLEKMNLGHLKYNKKTAHTKSNQAIIKQKIKNNNSQQIISGQNNSSNNQQQNNIEEKLIEPNHSKFATKFRTIQFNSIQSYDDEYYSEGKRELINFNMFNYMLLYGIENKTAYKILCRLNSNSTNSLPQYEIDEMVNKIETKISEKNKYYGVNANSVALIENVAKLNNLLAPKLDRITASDLTKTDVAKLKHKKFTPKEMGNDYFKEIFLDNEDRPCLVVEHNNKNYRLRIQLDPKDLVHFHGDMQLSLLLRILANNKPNQTSWTKKLGELTREYNEARLEFSNLADAVKGSSVCKVISKFNNLSNKFNGRRGVEAFYAAIKYKLKTKSLRKGDKAFAEDFINMFEGQTNDDSINHAITKLFNHNVKANKIFSKYQLRIISYLTLDKLNNLTKYEIRPAYHKYQITESNSIISKIKQLLTSYIQQALLRRQVLNDKLNHIEQSNSNLIQQIEFEINQITNLIEQLRAILFAVERLVIWTPDYSPPQFGCYALTS